MNQETKKYIRSLNAELSYLYGFARQMNELDFAGALGGEFRGMQDPGWATTITAREVFDEIQAYTARAEPMSKAELRVVLMLYCQLAEAGGVYESIKNMMGIVTAEPYNLWPFKDIVRVRASDKRIIGPNANKTFQDLATKAKAIGMAGLARLLETVFRDDIRNGIYHADYVIWNDGLRLRRRNGGMPDRVSMEEVGDVITRGTAFFQILQDHNTRSQHSFNPPKEIVGKFSANPPFKYTVFSDPERRSFSISTSSAGPETTPEYLRQIEINGRLGGRVLAAFPRIDNQRDARTLSEIEILGYEPNVVPADGQTLTKLEADFNQYHLFDQRAARDDADGLIVLSPFGFRRIASGDALHEILPPVLIELDLGDD